MITKYEIIRKLLSLFWATILTENRIPIVNVVYAHLDVLYAEIHLQLLKMKILSTTDIRWSSPNEYLGFNTLCEQKIK